MKCKPSPRWDEILSLARSSSLFAAGTLVSRFSGVLRDSVVAAVFGASSTMDAFLVANRIPNLFRDMLAEGALGSSFTKVYSTLCHEDPKRAQRLLVDSLKLTAIIMILITTIGVLTAPWLVKLFTMYSFKSDRGADFYFNAVGLTRVMFPFLGFASLAAIAMGVLQQRGKFFLAAVSPIALNVGYIVGALVFAKLFFSDGGNWISKHISDGPIFGLALGVLIGGLGHFLVQFIAVWKDLKQLDWHSSKRLITPDIRKVLILMAPAVIASSAASFNALINTNFATSLEAGAVTWLNYAFRLLQLPIGIFGVAIGAAVLPSLSRALSKTRGVMNAEASSEAQTSIEFILWLMVPCSMFLIANDVSLVSLLFGYGKFDQGSIIHTAEALKAYSYGVVGYGLIKVLSSIYFALERTNYAMRASLTAVAINFTANYLMVDRYEHVGLAAAASLSISSNALILLFGLRSSKLSLNSANLLKSLGLLGVAGLITFFGQKFCASWLAALDLHLVSALPKTHEIAQIGLNGILVFSVFAGLSLIRLGWGPADAFRQIKSFKKRLIK